MVSAIAALLNALLWPIAVIVIVLLFREPIREILRSAESMTLRIAGQELGFRRIVDNAAEKLIRSDPNAAKGVTPAQIAEARHVASVATRTALPLARDQMLELARQYETIRATMPESDARTRQMELVVTKMRTLALAAYPYRYDFSRSASPGERLAAIAILQISPDAQYWDWLADRLREEARFVGYHAAVALLMAVRTSEPSDQPRLRRSLLTAKEGLRVNPGGADRQRVIDDALRELDESVKPDNMHTS